MEWERRRRVQHLEFLDGYLDLAGSEFRILVALRALFDDTLDTDAVLIAKVVGTSLLEELVADHHLRSAGCIAQVNEGDASMISTLGHPTSEYNFLANVLLAERAGIVRADHNVFLSSTAA